MVRKKAIVIILMSLFLLTGCFSEHVSNRMVAKRAEKYMKSFADKDEKKLFSYFAEDIKADYKELTMKEIKETFDTVIDGNIISYEYDRDGGGGEGQSYGKIRYFSRSPKFCNVKTDTGKTYMIEFSYYHVWREHPELEGLRRVYIYKDNDFGEKLFVIGGVFDSKKDSCDGLWK